MKVLQVLNFSSSDGRYGGPQRVAESQIRGLVTHGLDCTKIALTVKSEASKSESNVLFTGHRILGFGDIPLQFSFSALFWLVRNLKRYEVVHIHFSRDLFTNAVALLCVLKKKKYFVQTHGMLQNHHGIFRKVWDSVLIGPLLMKANAVFVLTNEEKTDLIQRYRISEIKLIKLVNGGKVEVSSDKAVQAADRQKVLFASRLDPRKRPQAFLEMANLASSKLPNIEFVIAGSDAGAADEISERLRILGNSKISYLGALTGLEIADLLSSSACLVLPAIWDVFPMIMVESACKGVPVLAVGGYETSDWFAANGAAVLCDGSVEGLVAGLMNVLKTQAQLRETTGEFARRYLDENEIARELLSRYSGSLESRVS